MKKQDFLKLVTGQTMGINQMPSDDVRSFQEVTAPAFSNMLARYLSSDSNELAKYLKKSGKNVELIDNTPYIIDKQSRTRQLADPSSITDMPADIIESLVDPESLGNTAGSALGTILGGLAGGAASAVTVPALTGIGGGVGRKIKEELAKVAGYRDESEPSQAMSAGAMNAFMGTIPMLPSLAKATTRGIALKTNPRSWYAGGIGAESLAKEKGLDRANELIEIMMNKLGAGSAQELKEKAQGMIEKSGAEIDELLKGKGSVSATDLLNFLNKYTKKKKYKYDPATENQVVEDIFNTLTQPGGLFPMVRKKPGAIPKIIKRDLQEAEEIKSILGSNYKNIQDIINKGDATSANTTRAEALDMIRKELRELISKKSGKPKLYKALNLQQSAGITARDKIEDLLGKDFKAKAGNAAATNQNTFTALATSQGGPLSGLLYRAAKKGLNEIDRTKLNTKMSLILRDLQKINKTIDPKTAAAIMTLVNTGTKE